MYFSCFKIFEMVNQVPSLSNQVIYKRPWYLINGHLETIMPYLQYKIHEIPYERERLELQDGDFLDLDWIKNENDQLIIISHGFEGNSRDHGVERFAKYFSQRNSDILMWHLRSCGKDLNRLPNIYSFNDLLDLHAVIAHASKAGKHQSICLMGFSMGAITILNYLSSGLIHPKIKGAAVVSVPMLLSETFKKLDSGISALIYGRRFHAKLIRKLIRKAVQFPDIWDECTIRASDSIYSLTEIISAAHGRKKSYFDEISPLHHLPQVSTPVLVINAKNDPLLGSSSYPDSGNSHIRSCYPSTGGHTGFSLRGKDHSWIELKSEDFFNSIG